MDLKLIKPKNLKVSDKYSTNLYKYLKKNPNSRIFYRKVNRWNEEELEYNVHNFSIGNAILGVEYHDNYVGNCLMDILQKSSSTRWCYLKSMHGELVDITDEFFRDYELIGRCLFDPTHSKWVLGDDKRFTYINEDSRICNWCGQSHTKRIETETIVKEYEIWE